MDFKYIEITFDDCGNEIMIEYDTPEDLSY